MKYIYILKNSKSISFFLLSLCLFLNSGCSSDDKGWSDERYLSNFQYSIEHNNPLTGSPYTEVELAALDYNPKTEERYAEGQPIELTLISAKMPSKVKVLSGVDLSVLSTINNFTQEGDIYKSETFISTLENLGLLAIGDKTTIQFKIEFVDGSIGAIDFQIERVKFFNPNAIVNSFVYLVKGTGETLPIPLESETLTAPWVYDASYGAIVDFNGSSDKIEVSQSADLNFRGTENFSVGIWVNTTSTGDDPVIIGDKDWGSGSKPGFLFALTGGDWKLNVGDGTKRIDIGGGVINDGNWHYLMATFDRGGNVTLYQDGVSQGSSSMAGFGSMNSGLPIQIAQDGTGGYGLWYGGKTGQVTIYDYALTAQQVAGISTPNTGFQLSKADGTIKNVAVSKLGVTVGIEEDRYTFTFDGLKFATVDNSGLDFRYVGDFTVTTWVKTTATNSDPSIIGDKDWNSGSSKGFVFAFLGGNWKLNAGDGSNRIDIAGNAINDDEWHLLAATFNRANGKATLYQDGVPLGNKDISALGDMNSGLPIHLAEDGTGSYGPFTGKLAKIKLFDYALTDAQMLALFNSK